MPPKFGGGEKCARCNKTVYAAEKVNAASNVRNFISQGKLKFFLTFFLFFYCCYFYI